MVHYQPSYNTSHTQWNSDPLLLADGNLRCGMYPASSILRRQQKLSKSPINVWHLVSRFQNNGWFCQIFLAFLENLNYDAIFHFLFETTICRIAVYLTRYKRELLVRNTKNICTFLPNEFFCIVFFSFFVCWVQFSGAQHNLEYFLLSTPECYFHKITSAQWCEIFFSLCHSGAPKISFF